jgi:hypothetical protein
MHRWRLFRLAAAFCFVVVVIEAVGGAVEGGREFGFRFRARRGSGFAQEILYPKPL